MRIAKLPRKGYWLIHMLCVALLAGGVFCLYSLSRNSYFPYIINQEGFQETDDFEYQFFQNVDRALRYTDLKQKLETNGQLDFSKTVAIHKTSENSQTMLNLQDAVEFGASIGLSFDKDKRLVVGSEKVSLQDLQNFSEELSTDETTVAADGEQSTDSTLEEIEIKAEDNELWKEILTNEASSAEKSMLLELLYQLAEYYNLQRHLGINGDPCNFYYRFVFTNSDGEPVVSTNMSSNGTSNDLLGFGKFFNVTSEDSFLSYRLSSDTATSVYQNIAKYGIFDGGTFEIVAAVDTNFPADDGFREDLRNFRQIQIFLILLLIAAVLALIVWGLSLTGLFQTIGKEKKPFDTWYLEAALFVCLIPAAAAVWAGASIYNGFLMSYSVDIIGGLLVFILAYVPILWAIFSFFRRIRTQDLRKASILNRISRSIGMLFRGTGQNGSHAIYAALGFLGYVVLNTLFVIGSILYIQQNRLKLYEGRWSSLQINLVGVICFGGFILLNLVFFIQAIRKAFHREKIAGVVKKISEGKLEAKIDTNGMNGSERVLSESVNEIGEGLSRALVEQTKSERMRTDLIANVSHDLRTPLTSIINYVDLLKREHLPGERVQGYLNVLEQKAQRLRNLTEDLVEASKASSGNVSVNWETINFVQMINQMNGEFQERFDASGLKEITTMENVPVLIRTDGRLLFRVLENLYNNVCKYAMPGTRVYIDLKETSHKAIFTMKNISADPLNIAPEELTERFIRGDVSRTTEGSGLGLSIAKSITELLKGTFEIYLEGDLFRARLVFSLAEEEE